MSVAECGGGEPGAGVLSFFSRRVTSLLFRGPSEQVGGAVGVGPVSRWVGVGGGWGCGGGTSEQVGGAVGVGPVSRWVGLWGWDQ